MQIGLLQAGHMPDEITARIGDYDRLYGELLADQDIQLTTWPVVDDVFPPAIDAAPGWLISGSRHGAYDDLPWIRRLEDFIREAYAARVPIVGICFGHQIVAQALGGRVEKFSGGWSIGRQAYDWGGDSIALNAWHQDQVTDVPEGARVIASSDFCANAAMAYAGPAFTIQPHPEFERAAVESLLEVRAPGVVPPDLIDGATEALDADVDNRLMAEKIGAFFREHLDG